MTNFIDHCADHMA